MRLFRTVLICLCALMVPFATIAQEPDVESPAMSLQRWDEEAQTIERALEFQRQTLDEISQMRVQLERQLAAMPPIREATERQLQPLRDQLDALGEPPEDPSTEAPQITLERKRLQTELADQEARVKRIDQASARAIGLISKLTRQRQDLFTERLTTRGPSPFDAHVLTSALIDIKSTVAGIVGESASRLATRTMDAGAVATVLAPLALMLITVTLLVRLRRWLVRRVTHSVTERTPRSRRVAAGAAITLARLLLPATGLSILMLTLRFSGLLGPKGLLLLEGLAAAALMVIGAYALGAAYFAPQAPLLRLSRLDNQGARRANRWLLTLAAVLGLDQALVSQGEEIGIAVEALTLLNFALILLGSVALIQFVRQLRAVPIPVRATGQTDAGTGTEDEAEDSSSSAPTDGLHTGLTIACLITIAAALAAPLLAAFGYYAAARYVFFPMVLSGAVIALCMLLFHVVSAVVDHLTSRGDTGTVQTTSIERLQLIPILLAVALGIIALPVLALIWGADVADLSEALRRILSGMTIGEVTISPTDIAVFVAVIAIGLLITRQFKGVLRRNVLPLTGLDTGGRDAIVAGTGYLGIIITLLVAISSTGLDLSNIALVAGALTVGIGFGLQNIVNNFVSGIILLIERPIKSGDWIELPSGMGYVKNINVRSTEVETFDRSSLFVPNSELISGPVTNWTHGNLNGRVIVAASVAHASDPRHVERVLLEIARAHPMVLRRPPPFVLFRGMSTDALNFEIRGILRDVNWVLNVQSDLNFEIVRRFAEEGISIPFRQSDVHLRDLDQVGSAVGAALAARNPPPAKRDPGEPEAAAPPRIAPPSPRSRVPAGLDQGDADAGDGPGGDGGPR